MICRPADIVYCHTSKDREIKIYVRFSLIARLTILVREDRIPAMPYCQYRTITYFNQILNIYCEKIRWLRYATPPWSSVLQSPHAQQFLYQQQCHHLTNDFRSSFIKWADFILLTMMSWVTNFLSNFTWIFPNNNQNNCIWAKQWQDISSTLNQTDKLVQHLMNSLSNKGLCWNSRYTLNIHSDCWTLSKNKETCLDAFEMKGLRKTLGVSWTAKETNEWVLKEDGSTEATVRQCHSTETSILWSYHDETKKLPG